MQIVSKVPQGISDTTLGRDGREETAAMIQNPGQKPDNGGDEHATDERLLEKEAEGGQSQPGD